MRKSFVTSVCFLCSKWKFFYRCRSGIKQWKKLNNHFWISPPGQWVRRILSGRIVRNIAWRYICKKETIVMFQKCMAQKRKIGIIWHSLKNYGYIAFDLGLIGTAIYWFLLCKRVGRPLRFLTNLLCETWPTFYTHIRVPSPRWSVHPFTYQILPADMDSKY